MSHTMNGQPLVCWRRSYGVAVRSNGFDAEDFAETMRRAKARGLIHDGPAYRIDDDKPKTKNVVMRTRICVVCGSTFERPSSSVAKGCTQVCTRKLRSDAAFAKYQRAGKKEA